MFKHSVLAVGAALLCSPLIAGAFTPGNLVVYRVGDGSAVLTSAGTAAFVDEYTPGGTLVSSLPLSTGASFSSGLTASGTATSDGYLTVSTDGKYVMVTGYGAAIGTTPLTTSTSATVPRVVGRIDVASNAVDTSTRLTNFSSGGNFRAAASTDGTNLWITGSATGAGYATLGSSSATALSTTVANLRTIQITGGQLYTSTQSGSTVRVGSIGTGTPTTSGQVITNLPGFATSGSPYGFYFADLSAGVAGMDTLYVADDGAGLTKYSLVGGNWVSNGTVGAAANALRGLTGSSSAGGVSLYATGNGTTLYALTDTSGYNGSFVTSLNTLASAGTNTAIRGIALLPVPEPGSWALMIGGLAAISFLARRRA